jgi:hypothetical protein
MLTSLSLTEAFSSAGKRSLKGRVNRYFQVVSDTYIECCQPGANQGVSGLTNCDVIPVRSA